MNIMDQVVEVTADAFRLAKFLAETRAAQIRGGLPLGCHVCGEHYGHRPVVFPGGTTAEPCPLGVFERSAGYAKKSE